MKNQNLHPVFQSILEGLHQDQQIESALNEPMYEYKFFKIFDKTKTIVTDWCTESNFADAHPGVIVTSKTN
jgi:hypothetical protein